MKNKLIKYRSVVVITTSLIFNLVSSLLVWHPDGQKFNTTPLTASEWICDIVSIVWFLFGMMMMFFDIHQNQKEKIKEAIFEAKEIELKDTSEYIYDEESEQYFSDEFSFVDYWWELYQEGDHDCSNFDEYFEKYVPKVLWNCEVVKISMDADSIIENACEELHEDARDYISDEKELQDFLDKWCGKQTGTTTYYPCYKEYVKVQKKWFD